MFPQLHSHILGALNAGARLEEIRAIFDQTEYVWGKEEQTMVDGFWLDFAQSYNYHKQGKSASAALQKSRSEKGVRCPSQCSLFFLLTGGCLPARIQAKVKEISQVNNDAGSVFTG